MIRHATHADTPRLVEMSERFLAESSFGRFMQADPEKLTETFDAVIAGVGVVFVAEQERTLIGYLAIAAVRMTPMGSPPYAEELAWWMEPEHRGGREALQMLWSAEDWTTRNGLSGLSMKAPFGSQICTFYTKSGYEPVETAFFKRFDDGSVHKPGNRRGTARWRAGRSEEQGERVTGGDARDHDRRRS